MIRGWINTSEIGCALVQCVCVVTSTVTIPNRLVLVTLVCALCIVGVVA
jgi:hypothetical protein